MTKPSNYIFNSKYTALASAPEKKQFMFTIPSVSLARGYDRWDNLYSFTIDGATNGVYEQFYTSNNDGTSYRKGTILRFWSGTKGASVRTEISITREGNRVDFYVSVLNYGGPAVTTNEMFITSTRVAFRPPNIF